MKSIVWLLIAVLIIFHQDFWNWHSTEIYFGFMPIGLLYHVGVSIAAACVWWIACTFCWPEGIDEFEEESTPDGDQA